MTNYNKLIQRSFICGLILQALCILVSVGGVPLLLLLFAGVFPGLFLSIILVDGSKVPQVKSIAFIGLSSVLSLAVAIGAPAAADEYHSRAYFLFVSALGCCAFFTLYYLLVNNGLHFTKGLVLTFATGLISSILPMVGENFGRELPGYLDLILLFSSFPVWQTLFALSLKLSAKNTVDMPIQNTVVL